MCSAHELFFGQVYQQFRWWGGGGHGAILSNYEVNRANRKFLEDIEKRVIVQGDKV